MITVFFEMNDSKYCEQIATFEDEDIYQSCLPVLEKICKERGFDFISESQITKSNLFLD